MDEGENTVGEADAPPAARLFHEGRGLALVERGDEREVIGVDDDAEGEALSNDPEGRIHDILFLGYIYGEEERALVLAEEVRARYAAVTAITLAKPLDDQLRVLALTRFSDKLWVAGSGSTEGGVIDAAGGVNVAAEAGIKDNATTSLEGVISMAPEIIFITQPLEFGAEEFRQDLLNDPALAATPAIINGRIYIVNGKFFTTLSFWNIRGVEDLAAILWPEDFVGATFGPFSTPEEE